MTGNGVLNWKPTWIKDAELVISDNRKLLGPLKPRFVSGMAKIMNCGRG